MNNNNNIFKIIIMFITIVLTISNFCFGQGNFLGYYPNTPLRLGRAFILNDPSIPQPDFLESFDTDTVNNHGATSLSFSIIHDVSTLRQALHADAYLSVRYLSNNLSASYNLNENSFYNQNSITLALTASTDFGTVGIKNPVLNSKAQKFIDSQDYFGFINAFGDHYVAQISRGVSVALFLTITNVSSELKNTINAGVTLNGNIGTVSVDASAHFSSELNKTSSSDRLEIQIASNGGDFTGLTDLIKQSCAKTNALDSIKSAFANYMKQFTISNAQITGFTYGPMSTFKVFANYNSLDGNKIDKLTAIYDNYYNIIAKHNILNNILNSEYYKDFHNYSDAQEAIRLLNQFKFAEDSLRNSHSKCIADPCSNYFTCCNNPNFIINDALINKFLNFPLYSCIDNNPNFSLSYKNKTFTYTNIQDFIVNSSRNWGGACGDNFYYCSTSEAGLKGQIVKINVLGNVWNPGRAGDGDWNALISLDEKTSNGDSISDSFKDLLSIAQPGNWHINLNTTKTIGADGNITIALIACYAGFLDNRIPSTLTLRQGATIAISIPNLKPEIDAFISPGDTTICKGESIVLKANSCNGCKYKWYHNSLATGDTTPSITTKASGYYTVNVSNSIGSSTSYQSNITVSQPPAKPKIAGSSTLCEGSYDLLTANSDGCIGCTYTWLPGNQTGSTLKTNLAGTYTVVASNGCPPDATSDSKTLTISQPPATPTFKVTECDLVAENLPDVNYQWYINDNIIQGATSRFYTAIEKGHFSIKITDIVNGCSAISKDTLLICPQGIKEQQISNQLYIYPNPANNKIYIHTTLLHSNDVVNVMIINMFGVIIKKEKIKWSNNLSINVKSIPEGIYFIKISDSKKQFIRKLIIQ